MALTFTQFRTVLANLSITDVTEYSNPPRQVNAGDLPMGYPRLPFGDAGSARVSDGAELLTMQFEYVILVQSVPLNILPANYDATVAAMDSLHLALRTAQQSNHWLVSWNLRGDWEPIGENNHYWAVIATVTADNG